MKKNRFILLKTDINSELSNLIRLEDELHSVLKNISNEPSIIEKRAIGSILHDFYCGIEEIFKRIALTMDGELPTGEDWHIKLIDRVSTNIPRIRPKVINNKLKEELFEYLKFRHLFRHMYGFQLKWDRLKLLTENLSAVLKELKNQLNVFFKFLNNLK